MALHSRLIPGDALHTDWGKRRQIPSATLDLSALGVEWLNPEFATHGNKWKLVWESLMPSPGPANVRAKVVPQVVADFISLAAGFSGISALLHLANLARAVPGPALGTVFLYGTVFTLLGYSERLYYSGSGRSFRDEALLLAKLTIWTPVLLHLSLQAFAGAQLTILALAAPINCCLLLSSRWAYRKLIIASPHQRNVLIVGANALGRAVRARILQDPLHQRVVRGFLDEKLPIVGNVLGRIHDLGEIARREFVDEVVLTIPQDSSAAHQAVIQSRLNRLDIKLVPDLLGTDPSQATFDAFDDIPVLTLREEQLPALELLAKRGIDIFGASLALALTLPLMIVVGIAIRLDSPGPILFRATRVGRKGQRFLCYKFRTMVEDAEQRKGALRQFNQRQGAFFKIEDDPRITRIGKFLRRYSLDELPQLWNVLRGDMSLVGPRPHPLDDFARYQLEDFHRLDVTPGLTGLWQVTARKDPSFKRSLSLDREYIARWSLKLDFWILCKTIGIVLRGEGA